MSFTEKLKALFSEVQVNEPVNDTVNDTVNEPKKFMDIAVGDRMFRTDSEEFVEGSYIFEVMLVDGVETIGKVEDGEYEMADGTKFVVENDTVVSITQGEGNPEPEAEVDVEFQKVVVEGFETFSNKMKELTKINQDLLKELNEMKTNFSSQLEEIKNLPANGGVKVKKNGFQQTPKKTDYSELVELSKKYRK